MGTEVTAHFSRRRTRIVSSHSITIKVPTLETTQRMVRSCAEMVLPAGPGATLRTTAMILENLVVIKAISAGRNIFLIKIVTAAGAIQKLTVRTDEDDISHGTWEHVRRTIRSQKENNG